MQNRTVKYGTVGVVSYKMIREERCDRNSVVWSNTVWRLESDKLRCDAIFTKWWYEAVQ